MRRALQVFLNALATVMATVLLITFSMPALIFVVVPLAALYFRCLSPCLQCRV